jgi:hypothetical protein
MTTKKKKVEDFEVKVETKKVQAKAKKTGENVEVKVTTPRKNVEFTKTEEEQSFKFDSKKLDVDVVKTEEGTKVVVEAENSIMRTVGNWLAKFATKKLNKNEVQK